MLVHNASINARCVILNPKARALHHKLVPAVLVDMAKNMEPWADVTEAIV